MWEEGRMVVVLVFLLNWNVTTRVARETFPETPEVMSHVNQL